MMQRGRLTAFVSRHQTAWELVMGGLAVVYLAEGLLFDQGGGVSPATLGVLTVVFLGEFFARLIDAPSRSAYVRAHWLDFVSSIPLVGGLRSIRLLRLMRLGAVVRLFALSTEASEKYGQRQVFWMVGPIALLVWFSSSLAIWTLEQHVNPALHTFGDALYWSFITATTVGYGDVAPVTPEGRLVAGVLIIVGVGLVGVVSAHITGKLIHQPSNDAVQNELVALRAEIRGLRLTLESRGAAQMALTETEDELA